MALSNQVKDAIDQAGNQLPPALAKKCVSLVQREPQLPKHLKILQRLRRNPRKNKVSRYTLFAHIHAFSSADTQHGAVRNPIPGLSNQEFFVTISLIEARSLCALGT